MFHVHYVIISYDLEFFLNLFVVLVVDFVHIHYPAMKIKYKQ